MAQPHQQVPQGQYSSAPYTSPAQNPAIYPPNKRQRLSPNPSPQNNSPYASPAPQPQSPYPQVPNGGFGTLYVAQQPSIQPTHQPQQPNMPIPNQNESQPQPGLMPPPSKPADRAGDQGDLDILTGSGINLKDEENAMLSERKQNAQQGLRNSVSFASGAGTASGDNSFDTDPRFGQATPVAEASISQEQQQKQEVQKATHRLAGRSQYHLTDPFLHCQPLLERSKKMAATIGCTVPLDGLKTLPAAQANIAVEVMAPDGTSIIVDRGQPILTPNKPLEPILTLLSMACREHVRGKTAHALTLSTHRRLHSHGVIPEEWTDIAQKENAAQLPEDGQGGWESADHHKTNKDSISAKNTPRNASSEKLNLLKKAQEQEMSVEAKRAALRLKRKGLAASTSGPGSATGALTEPGTPTPIIERPLDLEKKSSKKELKQAEARASEAAQHHNANQAARLAMNVKTSLFGGKKKSYGWMTGGGLSSGPSTPGPSRINTSISNTAPSTPNTASAGSSAAPETARVKRQKLWGEYREDGPEGAGIQLGDIIAALQDNPKFVQGALQRLYVTQSLNDVRSQQQQT